MAMDDLALFGDWLADPEVEGWFRTGDLSATGIERQYGPRIEGDEAVEQWLALIDGTEVGWLQTYALDDDADYQRACVAVGVDGDAAGIDYLVATGWRDRGLGPRMIDAFVDDVVFGRHDRPEVCSGPHPENVRSWRALEKAGFRFAGLIDTAEGPERLMSRRRPARR